MSYSSLRGTDWRLVAVVIGWMEGEQKQPKLRGEMRRRRSFPAVDHAHQNSTVVELRVHGR